MGTRGLLGIRNNKELLKARYNGYDSYYSNLGKEVIGCYFNDCGIDILRLTKGDDEDKKFLQDGLFCEYAYVYNQENDTLEIYRGFFKTKQAFNTKEQILNNLEDKKEDKHFCHLIMIIDRKKHKKVKVIEAFDNYDNDEDSKKGDYPEREIISLELPKNYVQIV